MKEVQITLLKGIKERLFQNGWQKGSLGGLNGPNCIMGAMDLVRSSNYAHYATGTGYKCSVATVDLLDEVAEYGNVVTFNDHEDTSFDDIVDLIDLAIKTLEME